MISSHIARAARTVVPTGTLQFACCHSYIFALYATSVISQHVQLYRNYQSLQKLRQFAALRHDSKIRGRCANSWKLQLPQKIYSLKYSALCPRSRFQEKT